MNKIDTIIKYLSGELDPLSKMEFEKALETIPDQAEMYSSVLKIWNTMKEYLAIEELPDGKDRQEFIAEVIATYDIQQYRTKTLTKKEQDFKEELGRVMQMSALSPENNQADRRKFNYRLTVLVIASAAVFILMLIPGPNISKLASDFYKPLEDMHAEQFPIASRSEKTNAMIFFQQGEFYPARVSFEKNEEKLSPKEKLIYALCCNETGDIKKSLILLEELSESNLDTISYKANWYLSLLQIKQGELEKAKIPLSKIVEADGIYHKKARRLHRKIN